MEMSLVIKVNGEDFNEFPLRDGDDPFNRQSEITAIDQAYIAKEHDPTAEVVIVIKREERQYLDARFDVTDLSEEERGHLAGYVSAQAEGGNPESYYPSVEVELDWVTA